VKHAITLIPGDGIGPELVQAAVRVLEATGVEFDWEVQTAGAETLEKEGHALPPRVLQSLKRTRVGLKGPITTPVGTGFRSVNVSLRTDLDLYANVRPAKTYPGIPVAVPRVDIVVVRENTEDLYVGLEFDRGTREITQLRALVQRAKGRTFREDAAVSLKPISVGGSRRIVEFAFDYARRHGRRKVTAAHKANIMKYTDGLFLEVAREVASQHPQVEFEDVIVDALCMRLVQHPRAFDVLVLPNLYGDIVSDLTAGLIGGLGVAPGANYGAEVALFEPVHGSAPKFRGSGRMNPTALILSGALMLRHIGERDAAGRVERALATVLADGRQVTEDLLREEDRSRAVDTETMANAVIAALPAPVASQDHPQARGGR
jgi:isocitrate dehydrogenase (NAD+)